MKALRVSKDLSLPLEFVTQACAILAKRRVGKSYTLRRILEQLLRAGQQTIIVDPKGDAWGIRSGADGKTPGIPVTIFGGEHGDVALRPDAGEAVARIAVEEQLSFVLDLSELRKHEVATFMAPFLETLYRLKAREAYRTPVMVAVDEGDAIAPQKPQPNEARMLGAAEDLVRRGGQRGIGTIFVTQRAAVLNKNVLTQAQVLIALRTIAPHDLAAMNDWIDVHGTTQQRKLLMESLPSLPVGDAWVWSPGWPTEEGIFQRVHVDPIETYDSGATPKPGEKRIEPKMLAPADLDRVRDLMADVTKREPDDAKTLRMRIAELEREVAKKPAAAERVEVPVFDEASFNEAFERVLAAIGQVGKATSDCQANVGAALNGYRKHVASGAPRRPSQERKAPRRLPESIQPRPSPTFREKVSTSRTPPNGSDLGNSGARRMLTVLCQSPGEITASQLALRAGIARRGGTFRTYLGKLLTNGWAERTGDRLLATSAGKAVLGPVDPLPRGADLFAFWMRELGSSGAARMLDALYNAYPKALSKAELGARTDIATEGGTFRTYLGKLKTLELVEGKGDVRLSEELVAASACRPSRRVARLRT